MTSIAKADWAQPKPPAAGGTKYPVPEWAKRPLARPINPMTGMQMGMRPKPSAPARPAAAPAPPQQPSVRNTVRQQAAGIVGPKPSAPGMPLGMPSSMQQHWAAAQQMFPGMSSHQQQQMAWHMKNQQERQSQMILQQAQQDRLGQWSADQYAIGQNLNPRNPYPDEAARFAAQAPIQDAQAQRLMQQRQQMMQATYRGYR